MVMLDDDNISFNFEEFIRNIKIIILHKHED